MHSTRCPTCFNHERFCTCLGMTPAEWDEIERRARTSQPLMVPLSHQFWVDFFGSLE